MFSTSQKNTFLKAIQEKGMDAREFKISSSVEPIELRVEYKPEKFYFRVNYKKAGVDQYNRDVMALVAYSTPKPGLVFDMNKEQSSAHIDKWETILAVLGNWLQLLKTEFKQPDLWAELERTPNAFIESESLPEDAFTPAEIKLLEARLPEVEQQIIDLDLPPDAEAAITAIVQEVPAKAKRLTKKELADTLIGSLVKEGIKWTLTTEHVSFVWHACQHFFTFLLPG